MAILHLFPKIRDTTMHAHANIYHINILFIIIVNLFNHKKKIVMTLIVITPKNPRL